LHVEPLLFVCLFACLPSHRVIASNGATSANPFNLSIDDAAAIAAKRKCFEIRHGEDAAEWDEWKDKKVSTVAVLNNDLRSIDFCLEVKDAQQHPAQRHDLEHESCRRLTSANRSNLSRETAKRDQQSIYLFSL